MKTYVLDVLENVLTEEEANQYYQEKLHYKNSIKKLRRSALDKKKFFNKDKDILEMIFKMGFRDVFGFQKNYRIYFSNLKILITSLTDYYYFITFLDKDEERVKNLVKKSKLFLR